MTVIEAKKIIAVMLVSFPNFKPTDVDSMAETWADMLSEYSYSQVSMALKAYIVSDTSGFAPSIGQLVGKIQTISQPQELNEMEAWSLVSRAIRNSTYNSVVEFAKLPPMVQKAVGLPDQLRTWAMDENYNEQVASSNFIKCYRTEVARSQELSKMPSDVRKIIERACNSSYVAQMDEKRTQAVKSLTDRKKDEIKAIGMSTDYYPMPEAIRARMSNLFKEGT